MFQALATLVITTLPLLPTTSRASVLSVYLHTQLTPLLLFLHLTHISPSSIWFSCFSSSSPGPRGLDGTCCFKSSDYQQFCSSFPLLTALGELLLCLRQRLQSFLHNGVKKKRVHIMKGVSVCRLETETKKGSLVIISNHPF